MTPLAWHHADLGRLGMVVVDGRIAPSRRNPAGCRTMLPPEAAEVVWLTTSHRGDALAAAASSKLPAVRIAVALDATLPVQDLARHGWTPARLIEVATLGQMHGADPGRWRVHLGPIPLESTVVAQILIGGRWRDVHEADLRIGAWSRGPGAIRVQGYGLDFGVEPRTLADGRRGYRALDLRGSP